jgi:hypothetical protein
VMSQTAVNTSQHTAMLTAAITFTMQTNTPGTGLSTDGSPIV